jgi:hypothetical protein
MSSPEKPRTDLSLEEIARKPLNPEEVEDLYNRFSDLVRRRGQKTDLLGCRLLGLEHLIGPQFLTFEICVPIDNEKVVHLGVRQKKHRHPEEESLVVFIGQVIDDQRVGLFLTPEGKAEWIYPSFYLQRLAKVKVPEAKELEPYREILQRLSETK